MGLTRLRRRWAISALELGAKPRYVNALESSNGVDGMPNWSRRGVNLALAAVLAGTIGLAGCSKIERSRGYVPDASELAEITIGVDNKLSVQESLGSPSTIGAMAS